MLIDTFFTTDTLLLKYGKQFQLYGKQGMIGIFKISKKIHEKFTMNVAHS